MNLKPKRRADDDEDDGPGGLFDMMMGPKAFKVTCTGKEDGPCLFNIYIFSEITKPEQFIPAIEALQAADEEDLVVIHLSSPGGSIDATDTFLHSLNGTRARVLFVASGGCHSAATLILMHANEISFSEGFNALVHNGYVGSGSKFSDWESSTDYTRKHMRELFQRTYKGFLSDKEIEDLIAGKDYWLNAEQFKKRLLKRNKTLKNK